MSNDEDTSKAAGSKNPKRIQRDGRDPCGLCAKLNRTCAYDEHSVSLGRHHFGGSLSGPSFPSRQYVEDLEMRLQMAEALLAEETTGASEILGVQLARRAIRGLEGPVAPPHSDDLAFADIDASFQTLCIKDKDTRGFHGKSSGAMLVKTAVDLKNENLGPPERMEPVSVSKTRPPATNYAFPDEDLLFSLVSLYFENNTFLPLLHRPSFERAVRHRSHRADEAMARTVLLVCALGARYSTDPRVQLSSAGKAPGWQWFEQVQICQHFRSEYTSIIDVQCSCLTIMFLDATVNPRICWNIVGFALRAGQDIGLHRFNMDSRATAFERELERRASWVLLLFDTQIGAALGRGSTLESHEFELHMPIICDDEYWGSPETTNPRGIFRQPPEKPSVVAFFNCMIHLNRILALSCKILYSSDSERLQVGLEAEGWQGKIVGELESALDAWFEIIPHHLRWDPRFPIQDNTFFDQSAALHCAYHHTRIVIHRPLISTVEDRASRQICIMAARACSQVAEIQHRRRPNNPLLFSKTALFTSAIVLLMNVWGGPGNVIETTEDLDGFHRCILVLRAQRRQCPSVDHLLEMLEGLVALSFTPASPPHGSIAMDISQGYHQSGRPMCDLVPHESQMEVLPPPAGNYLETKLWFPYHASDRLQAPSRAPGARESSRNEFIFAPDPGFSAHDGLNSLQEHSWCRAPAGFGFMFRVTDWQTHLEHLFAGEVPVEQYWQSSGAGHG
ncbi:fungal-specific transcription factor domain-containing protein [Mycena rosella]|uniref:Fungal-specific transcription factor domain-containing protein n=1 Tax=Mycena rosella TaxID=1033263 RepID=A0AAD7BZM9_MYCRO|nr:fungal-specific transcription factor domain-containing protein [Mycena rosella]